ncbi:hypothetical protein CRUP_016224, partial [Coryphaenoides rupestris]
MEQISVHFPALSWAPGFRGHSPRVPETMSILCMMLSLSPTPAPWAPYSPTACTSSTKDLRVSAHPQSSANGNTSQSRLTVLKMRSPTSSWTSELARTTPIWETTKGQSLARDTATWLADWAKRRLGLTAMCFGWPSWAPGVSILGSALLTVIWRTMMGHRSARESRAAPVRRSAGLGADFRKGQWCRKAAMALKLVLAVGGRYFPALQVLKSDSAHDVIHLELIL